MDNTENKQLRKDIELYNSLSVEKRKEVINFELFSRCQNGVDLEDKAASVLFYPNPTLRRKATDVTDFGETTQRFIDLMITTLYTNKGVGLAAPQIGWDKRVFVIDLNSNIEKAKSDLLVFVNPEITKCSVEKEVVKEGCLSFPGITESVSRSFMVEGHALDRTGKEFTFSYANDLHAIAVQHEMDHLNGVLLIDHLPRAVKHIVSKKMDKLSRKLNNPEGASRKIRRRGGLNR